MATPELTDLQNGVLQLLHESQDTPVSELDETAGGTAAITTLAQITTWLNEGAADLCRNAIAVPGSVSVATQSAQFYTYEGLGATVSGGQHLWYARAVSWAGVFLKPISRTALEAWFPTWQTDATGTPLYWFRNGVSGFGVYPVPTSAATLAAAGFELPVLLASDSDTLALWIADELTKLVIWYATAQVALQNDEDMSLKSRAVTWSAAYEQGCRELQMQLWQSDPSLARALWGAPLIGAPMGAQPPQGQ